MPRGNQNLAVRSAQHLSSRDGRIREKMIVECVGPQDHSLPSRSSELLVVFSKPRLKCFGCKRGYGALTRNICGQFGGIAQHRELRNKIDESWSERRCLCPLIDQAECVCR